jgi:RimJ/RimL family protein N-acetyltransferase
VSAPHVRLVPFSPAYLPAVLPWFDHPEVQHRLGGRDWPERELALRRAGPHEEFRGRRVLRGQTFVALDADGRPVAQIGGDVYDRWTVWDPATERVAAVDPRRTMGSAFVVDPARWGQGYGRATLIGLLGAPETADVEQFVLGIDADNAASLRAAASAGFVPLSPDPDAEGMVYVSAVR